MSDPFLSEDPGIRPRRPMVALVLANTMLSTVPGISGAGPTPEATLLTPVLDAELVTTGAITSMPARPNTPTGCPTPAAITRSMVEMTGLAPIHINAGLAHTPTVPCLDIYGRPGGDPREGDAVPEATRLFERGEMAGRLLSQHSDLLVIGECVPGGTTTALCVLRALGYEASVSSALSKPSRPERRRLQESARPDRRDRCRRTPRYPPGRRRPHDPGSSGDRKRLPR